MGAVNHIFFTYLNFNLSPLFKRVFLLYSNYIQMLISIRSVKALGFLGFLFIGTTAISQNSYAPQFKKSALYAGIEVGSKGVKMTVLEVAKNEQTKGTFHTVKDTSVNTDFISFTDKNFINTVDALAGLYVYAKKEYNISPNNIFTAVSSGVVGQAEKDSKQNMVKALADSFRMLVKEPNRVVTLIDVNEEARLSHLGIVPANKRYTTFLIDIGSGNTKGGYFPDGNTNHLKLFQVSWGTKSIANGTEKRMDDDNSLANFKKQLYRVLEGTPDTEITYAVNVSGAYNMSDNIAFSGGIAWSVATLIHPEMIDNPVVPITYDEVEKFSQKLYDNYIVYNETMIVSKLEDKSVDAAAVAAEVKRVHKVFDQKSLMAGTGLLLKIMRQFEGVYEKKQFYLVKNGQVGWISAYVDQNISQ